MITAEAVVDLTDKIDEKEESEIKPLDPSATLHATSIDRKYEQNQMKPMSGDLVLSYLGEIRHPVRHFLILGTVLGFKK